MNLSPKTLNHLMGEALTEARKAFELGEVPIGAIITDGENIISRAHNLVESMQDATAHAECLAIKAASQKIQNWRLTDMTLVVTLEPCSMCLGAIFQSRIATLVFGATDSRQGACGSLYDLTGHNQNLRVIRDIRGDECKELLSSFFAKKR